MHDDCNILQSVYESIYMYWDSMILFCLMGPMGVALWVQVWWPTAEVVQAYK